MELNYYLVKPLSFELANLRSSFDKFLEKYAPVRSEFEESKNYTKLLSKQIETLPRNSLDSSQHLQREIIQINLVPEDIQDTQFQKQYIKLFPLKHVIEWGVKIGWLLNFPAGKIETVSFFKKNNLNEKSSDLKNIGS